MIHNIFLDWNQINNRKLITKEPIIKEDSPIKEQIIKERKKKISSKNQEIDLASQPRMILRYKLHQQLNNKGLNYLVSPSQIYKNTQFQFVSLITCDEHKSESQFEFIKNLSAYAKKHQTNIWIYKPALDQMATNLDSLGYIKANILLKHLNNSYLIWIDQDYLILDQNKSMLDIICQYPDKSLILFYSGYKIRMDLMIWKPDEWTANVLNNLYLRKYSNEDPTKVLLEILSYDRDKKHVLVPSQVLMNPEKNWIKSYNDIPLNNQLTEMKMANDQINV
jgi:hypothetical protein